jgi:hypothetical protein
MKRSLFLAMSLLFATGLFAQTATIYDIQGQGPTSPYAGVVGVTTSGIVTAVVISGTTGLQSGFYIQDGAGAWNGVYVYDAAHIVTVGDNITLTGTVTEYLPTTGGYTNSQTEIKTLTALTINSTGNPAPAATVVTTAQANQEDYEGVLIQVVDAACSEWGTVAKTGHVADASTTPVVVYDKFIGTLTLAVGTAYNITGIVDIYHDMMELMPRTAGDVAIYTGVNIVSDKNFKIYPNPVNNVLYVNSENSSKIVVSNTIGQQIIRIDNPKTNEQIDVTALQSGMYFVSVTDQNGNTAVRKLIKK